MIVWSLLWRQWPLALVWGALASAAVLFTRFDGGIAFLWGAGAVLIAALVRTSRRHWWAPLTACAITSILISGTIGIGWALALPFMLINMGEPMLAAWIMKKRAGSGEVLSGLPWLGRFLVAVSVAPLLFAPIAAGLIWLDGGAFLSTLTNFIIGHVLGNLTLAPIAMMVTGRSAREEWRVMLRTRKWDTALILPLVVATCFFVFWQVSFPLTFLPVLMLVLATFRLGRAGAAFSIVVLAVLGGTLTGMGHGPLRMAGWPLQERLLFFQYYLVSTVLTILPIAADLHNRKRLHRQLKRSEAEFRLLADRSTDSILRIRGDGRIAYATPSIETLTGYSPAELVGRRSRILVDPRDFERVVREHLATMKEDGEACTYSYRMRRKDGEIRWLETHARRIRLEEGDTELLAVLRDVTQFKDREAELTEAALTDRLTGLPNRRALEQRLATLRPGEHCLALLDLDRFKQVNDTYGHASGDAVLEGFADFARRLVRSHDMVARLGGEEFVVLFEHTSIDQAYQVSDRMRRILGQTPLQTPAGPLKVTVSGGVATLGRGGLEPALKAADEALYRAKKGGRDRLLLAAA